MWLMLQQDTPDDYVIATSNTRSVRDFVNAAFRHIGQEILWVGNGVDEVGMELSTKKVRVKINPKFFRPTEVVSVKN